MYVRMINCLARSRPVIEANIEAVSARSSQGESAGAILGHTTPRERRGAAEEK